MANGDQTRPNFFELAGVDTSITQAQTQNRPNFLALAQTEAPTQTTSMIRPEMPTFTEAFFSSLGEELTFGKLYNDPRFDADELSGAAKAGKLLGSGAAFFGVTALATVATGGLGGLAMLGSSAARLQKGAQIYNAAKKAGKVDDMAVGIAEAGIGIKNSFLMRALGKNGVQKSYMDKFMKLAETDVAAARRFVLAREMGKEALIFGTTGQMMQEDDASFKQRAVAFGQDAVAGALFAVAPAFKFTNNPYIKSLGQSKSAELGSYFMSGFVTSLPNEEGLDLGSRVLTGALSTGLGALFGGATMQASKQDVRRALERIGLTDEKKLSEYSDIALGVINKQAITAVDEQYKTVDFSSFDKTTGEVKTTAKVRKVYVDPQDKKLKVEYQTYYKNGEPKDLVTRDFKNFNENYKRSDNNLVQEIKYNLDGKGGKFSFFEDQKQLESFLNTEKFGIITANKPVFYDNKAIGLYGETPNEVLIRELLSRGYKRNQIMAVEGVYNNVSDGRGFIVKGLKEKDAVELSKIFGQESVATQKGILNIRRPKRKIKKLENGEPVYDKDGKLVYEEVGYKVGEKKNEITEVVYNLKAQNMTEPDVKYRRAHQAQGPEDELPVRLDNLTRSTTGERAGYPDYFYSPQGKRVFAPGERKLTSGEIDMAGRSNDESYRLAKIYRNNPNATVTIYRGVPENVNEINRGDFVTLSPTYAKLHAENNLGPNVGKVISKKVKVKDVYWDQNDINEFGYFPEIKKNILYGTDAQKTEYYTKITSKNNEELSFSYLIDWKKDVTLRNPTMNKTQQLIRADEILLESSKKIAAAPERINLYKEIKILEGEAGLLSKSPLDNRHTALKLNVFGKDSITKMTDDELLQYKALIDNQPSYTTRLNDENGGILFDNNPAISNFKKTLNRFLPVSTKFGNLGRDLGSKELIKLEKDMTQMTRMREEIKGTYRASRDKMKDRYNFYDLSKAEAEQLDKELIYHIDDRFESLRSPLNNKQKAALNDVIKIHEKFVDDIFTRMKKANVPEKVFNGKNFENQDIQKVKNFVSLTVSDEASELLSRQDGPLRDSMIDAILKTDKRFKRGGNFFNAKNKYEIASEILDDTLSHSAKHGIYGAQYSRTAKLPPKIFLDESGAIISGVDNMKLGVGDTFNGVKIGKVVDTYILDYGLTMDRYAGRAASITSTSKFFGPEGVIKDGNFTKKFTERIRKMEQEVGNIKDINYIKGELEKDMDIVLRGDSYDEIVSPVLRKATAWTASVGLSSPRSALKNLVLGQVQTITTFGSKKYMRAMFKMMTDEKFQQSVYERAVKVGALDAGEQIVETVGVARRGEGKSGAIQRFLTKGMKVTEQKNRLISVAVAEVASDDALKVLAGKTDDVFLKMDKSQARRILEDVFQVEGWEQAIKRGSFNEDQLRQIYFRGHTLTQGLADPTALPRFMSNAYAKPFTLFYRIALRVTENVYQNAYKPLVQNGEVAPMLRYLAASTIAGATLQNMYYKIHNTDPDKFISAPERLWNYFVEGEGLGIFSAFAETNRPIAQSLTPAIVQNGQKLLGAMSLASQGLFFSETKGQQEILIKEAAKQLGQSVPIYNDIINGIRKNTDKATLTRFQTFRQKQGAFKSDILNTEFSGRFNYSEATTKSLMYKQLQANLYSDRTLQQKDRDFWSAVSFIQHQYEMANTSRTSKTKAFNYAFDRALTYLEDSEPINLSKRKTQGRTLSDYEDFTSRLNQDELKELMQLEQTYKMKLREYKQYVLSQKNKHRP